MAAWMVGWTDGRVDAWMGEGLEVRWQGDVLVDGWMFGCING
jgi:hypothetical protein